MSKLLSQNFLLKILLPKFQSWRSNTSYVVYTSSQKLDMCIRPLFANPVTCDNATQTVRHSKSYSYLVMFGTLKGQTTPGFLKLLKENNILAIKYPPPKLLHCLLALCEVCILQQCQLKPIILESLSFKILCAK